MDIRDVLDSVDDEIKQAYWALVNPHITNEVAIRCMWANLRKAEELLTTIDRSKATADELVEIDNLEKRIGGGDMAVKLTAEEILRRAREEVDAASKIHKMPTHNKSADTRRIRAALIRAKKLLNPLLSPYTRRGRGVTDKEHKIAEDLWKEIETVWR